MPLPPAQRVLPLRPRSIRWSKEIDELKAENAALRERLAMFESVLASDDEGVLMAGSDNHYVYANRAAHEIFSFAEGDIVGKRPEDLVPSEIHPLIEAHRALRRVGQASSYEVPLRDSQGRRRLLRVRGFPHETNGQRRGSFSFVTDITEQRSLENAVRESEERCRRLIENAPVGVYIGSQGKVAYCNPELARMLGAASPEEVVGLSVLRFIHPDDRAAAQTRIASYDAGEETETRRFEQRLQCLDGRQMITDVTVTPYVHDDLPAVQVVMRDITRHKLAEEELRASEHRYKDLALVLASTNTELKAVAELRDVLVRMIVHDIRSPLSAMMLVLDDGDEAGGLHIRPAEATIVRQQLAYSVELCNQLLDIQRLQNRSLPLDLRPGDIPATIGRGIAPLHPLASRQGVEVQLDAAALEWRTDHQLLTRVVTNLVSNAIKHSPRGGAVSVAAQCGQGQLTITVTDQGPGIARADQARVFDLFATAGEHSKRGHGIGLAFCKLAIESLGGEIELRSEPGSGCEFRLTLPEKA